MYEKKSKTVEFKFFVKLCKLPIVKSAVIAANDRYNGMKNANVVFQYACNTAEKAVEFVATTSKPMVNAYSNLLIRADAIAVQGLNIVLNNYPATKETPEELYNDGWKKIEEIKHVGVGKVNELKEYGQKRLDQVLSTTYGTSVVNSLNSTIEFTENAINYYLPPSECEPERKIEGNMLQKVSALSDITRKRLYQRALVEVQKIKKARDATLAPILVYAINCTINVHKHALKATDRLPERMKKIYNDCMTYSKDVSNQLAMSDNLKDASLIVATQVYTGMQSMTQYTINILVAYIPQLKNYKTKTE